MTAYDREKQREYENVLYAPRSARARLDRETGAVKSAVLDFIKSGMLEAAAQVTEALSKANPGDAEIDSYREMIKKAASDGGELIGIMKRLESVETIFILENAFSVRSGVVSSVFRKVKLMEDNWGYRPLILTCGYDTEFRRFHIGLRRQGAGGRQVRLNRVSRLINVYDYFQKSYADGLELRTVYHKDGAGVFDRRAGGGLVIKEHYTGIAGALCLAQELINGELVKETVYDDWGYISSVREGGTVYYYATDGTLCVKSGRGGLTVYENGGADITECPDDARLAALCLKRIMNDGKFRVLVFESGLMSKAAGETEGFNARRAIVAHSVFLRDSYDLTSEPQLYFRYMCENPEKFESIVFLTEAERDDFNKKYGGGNNTTVIPHPYPYRVSRAGFDGRDHRRAVIVARLDVFKQVGAAVDIFAAALKKTPGIRLDIYGAGDKEQDIKNQIKRLELEDSVFMMGVTDDPVSVFESAALCMTASAAEGFPLTLVESVCAGCPVFAFDVKYGAAEIVEDGKTGFLIPRFDKELYASKLAAFFKDTELQRTMSGNCYDSAERFGTDEFLKKWYELLTKP